MIRPQFSVRMLLTFIVVIAAMLWVLRIGRPRPVPLVSLEYAVREVNVKARDSEVGALEPQLTEGEVIATIRANLSNFNSRPEVKEIFQKIADSHALPEGSRLYSLEEWEPPKDQTKYVWWVNLTVTTEPGHGANIRIRNTMDPVYGRTHSVP
jgi:hypothetical protein